MCSIGGSKGRKQDSLKSMIMLTAHHRSASVHLPCSQIYRFHDNPPKKRVCISFLWLP